MKTLRRTLSPKLDPYPVARYRPELVLKGTRAETFEGEPSGVPTCFIGKGMIAVVEITDTASVIIEGRSHPSLGWIEAARFTASEERVIPSQTELRAIVQHNTGAVAVTLRTPS